ncbi:hypothetical protein M8C21_009599, partial [Ambrosia artemisiifolia]
MNKLRRLGVEIACALVGSLGALYTGVSPINVGIGLFALVAIESSIQSLGRTYAVLLFSAILLDILWFCLFCHEICVTAGVEEFHRKNTTSLSHMAKKPPALENVTNQRPAAPNAFHLVITKFGSDRIANMPLKSCREIESKYPSIKYNEIIVDNCCMQLVSKPEQFDVMVTPNLLWKLGGKYCCWYCWGTGVMPRGNVGADHAVFEQ